MKTRSVMVQTLCLPCACRCRYCLLSWNGQTVGADYERCERFAERMYTWIKQERPELSFHFSFGYSMEHPRLPTALDFMNRISSVSGTFLQCDGLAFRAEKELDAWLREVKEHGVESLNFTFYGTEAYHDRFAGRKGDHAYLLRMMEEAVRHGLQVSVGIPVTRENYLQIDALLSQLEAHSGSSVRLFIPHGEGRGAFLEGIRLSEDELSAMPYDVRSKLNRKVYQTEAEWCKIEGGEPEENRMLLVSLTKENIDELESTPFPKILSDLEALDDAYYAAYPVFSDLLVRYGDREGGRLYSRRDLYHRCRRQYAKEHDINVYDVTDERQSGSRRY